MLELTNVSVNFGGVAALRQVTFRVEEGETLGLVGPNGAGKTTLFNVISGVVAPSEGVLTFDGRPLKGEPNHARAKLGIGRSFQIPQPMHELTVRQNLIVAQRFGAQRNDPVHIDAILELLNLSQKAEDDAATSLALTEQKALEMGKALATDPKLLLLDEVLAGLETAGKRAFMDTIADVRERFGLTMIVIEHDIEIISTLCPRVVVLNFGKIIADGTPKTVFGDPEVIRSYTGETAA